MKTIFWLLLLVTVALPASASFQFAGEDADPASNLIYLRGRCYDPQTGTFISKDPLGVADSFSVPGLSVEAPGGSTQYFIPSH